MGQKTVFNALFAAVYLQQGHTQFNEDLESLASSLENSAYCLANSTEGIKERSKQIIYDSLQTHLERKLKDDSDCAGELYLLVDDMKNVPDLNINQKKSLAGFCLNLHNYAMKTRDEILPEVEKILGPLN